MRTAQRQTVAFLFAALTAVCASAGPGDTPGTGAFLPGQAAADLLRSKAGTDGAFIAADQIKTTYSKDDLASLLAYTTNKIVVVSLTGAQLKQAFERSLMLYPESNSGFLQLSGFEVTFSKSATPNARVIKATADGVPLDDHRTYTVAMPVLLGNGVLGYFKIWDKGQITKTLDFSVESVLKGKPYAATSPRWLPQ